ncbi:MAG: SDR family oxidoreductase [Acidimicrobiia bacterium]|nr:SDR family oxidoreductase [Acidimicrobiia bacterium]
MTATDTAMTDVHGAHRLRDRVAIVTGAASGIGRATAERLAGEGAKVACVDRDGDACAAAAERIRAERGPAIAVKCDLLDLTSIERAVQAAVDEWGGIDILCNIAGVGHFCHDLDESAPGWDQIIGVNLTGTFFMSQAALPHLLDGGGAIVNCASTSGTHGAPWQAAYSASKGGVIALTKSMAVSHGRDGIRVNCVAPGGVNTAIHGQFEIPEGDRFDHSLLARIMPFIRMGEPAELAAAFAYLASDDASYCNGITLRVDGGMMA